MNDATSPQGPFTHEPATGYSRERHLAAHRSNAAEFLASCWGVPLWTLKGPSCLDAAYRRRQRNRVKRGRR